ncbi:helix-turn-helix domain-containing protein [Pseudomonas petrae]|uniref:Helix-turn-helix domain-containing protein n=1 Tax=Pseudomonas petrae TaxID=2912190 RepID=A0ABS9I2R7_9PSED|nr:helix-turn-helix transcriptional regulator [Pseudomonas petrae]MCF7534996.1 helix-turn-helix domain-containing protein [Pseudomonas petrae]MCF7538168.1 helix-turn-helix domain-containing protein [Pseudomonas petrae]MCF7542085.1 helix-turn-helix domain-containing protein [Pseudomonas petrae]MCF7555530.1 helix-turn-helix domain-containing protein [Pseudomonas petrae]
MNGVGQRLRQERNRLKLSQSALGAIGGVETNAQGNYENGTRSPKAQYLLRIAEAGVDLNYVLSGSRSSGEGTCLAPLVEPGSNAAAKPHLTKVTHQLYRNLYGLIDASRDLTQLIDVRCHDTRSAEEKVQLESVRLQAQSLAQAAMHLIFESSKLG